MKLICVLVFVTLLFACGSRPASEATTSPADQTKTKTEEKDAAVKKVDSISKEEVKSVAAPVVAATKTKITDDPSLIVVRCKFNELELNPCIVYVFDCVRFENVNLSDLKPAQAKLWSSLMVFTGGGEGDSPVANPEYTGKTFEITYKKTRGEICNSTDTPGKGEVKSIVNFKIVEK